MRATVGSVRGKAHILVHAFPRLHQTWSLYTEKKKRELVTTKSCSFAAEKEEETDVFLFPCFSLSALLQCRTDKYYLWKGNLDRTTFGRGLLISAFPFHYNSSFVQQSPHSVSKAVSASNSPTTRSTRPPSAKHMHQKIIQISLPLCTWQHATVQWPNIRRVCG